MTDEEFEEAVKKLLTDEASVLAEEYLKQFQDDYFLGELKANDKIAIEILCYLYAQVRINQDKITDLQGKDDKKRTISGLITDNEKLIKGIASLENQLSISRTARMKDEGTDIVQMWDTVQEKARTFLEEKLHYVFCPKCHMMIANLWVLYPDSEDAYDLTFVCKREQKGETCDTEVIIKPGDLTGDSSQAFLSRTAEIE